MDLCHQIYLQQEVTPTNVTNVSPGQVTNWRLLVTNISGYNLNGPIVISSSLLGTLLVTASTFISGATIIINATYIIPSTTPNNSVLTSVAFASLGQLQGSSYKVLTRYSKVVKTSINVRNTIGGPTVQVSGNADFERSTETSSVAMELNITNQGVTFIGIFSINLNEYFNSCLSTPFNFSISNGLFQLSSDNNTLSLIEGATLSPGQTYNVIITALTCINPCTFNGCASRADCQFIYQYAVDSSSALLSSRASITYSNCMF